ncbi:uncharacterized protein I206_102732 [Kwoniella pini CBS 10737]|uniref:Uncharacterized protein n=1 Tax=Kwoniella pini CBS 10737 TaxID=1296096 RepID=A0A1B9I685_9TREE|nr:uncharacterized protein I206_03087 [Kwoniella pini CBS 10737]OCF51022.1 hypothetical protein I206_03087 [Kwoniella pini CBS 10737]
MSESRNTSPSRLDKSASDLEEFQLVEKPDDHTKTVDTGNGWQLVYRDTVPTTSLTASGPGTQTVQPTSYTGASTTPPLAMRGQYMSKSELLHPDSLQGRTFGDGYVLLVYHTEPEKEQAILEKGLSSLSHLARCDDATEETKFWAAARWSETRWASGRDPGVIYLKPVYEQKMLDAVINSQDSCIFVAAHPNSVNVFDAFHRESARPASTQDRIREHNLYKNFSRNLSDYSKDVADGAIIDQYARARTLAEWNRMHNLTKFKAEAVVSDDIIEPDYFVPPSLLDELVSKSKE